MQAKGWFTHQDIDSRSAGNLGPATSLNPTVLPTSTTFGYEEFNNGGLDLRFRKRWGDGTMFKGSALTFGGVVYHGEAPFQRYTLTNANTGPNFLYSPRGTTSTAVALDQDRTADYQAIFAEDLIRIGNFHIVPSFRLDHENVEVDSAHAPWLSPPLPANSPNIGPNTISADHWIPLWGIGLGNDFGKGNETYFNASSGWRPTRFFDIAGTARTIQPGQPIPDPFRSTDIELGIHGTPIKGFWYDVGLFWMEFENRTENINVGGSSTLFFVQNSGNTRHRGIEAEFSYDFLAPFQPEISAATTTTTDSKSNKDVTVPPPSHPLQLIVFSNFQYLDAEFTDSQILIPGTTQTLVGNEPAYAPEFIWKGGITFQKERCFRITFSGVHVSDQFWADNNRPNPATATGAAILVPAVIPSYTVFNFSTEVYVSKNVRLFGGVSNLGDEKYYSRVFLNGLIDPAPHRTGYAGVSVEF
jgi:Fe(3+) dicitrate transport protein